MPQQKKKKRQSGLQAKQHLQQQRNLQRKEYFAKLYELCKRFGVDKEVKEFIEDIGPSYYMLRLAGIRVFASKDSVKLTQKEEAVLKNGIYYVLNNLGDQPYFPNVKVSNMEMYGLIVYLYARLAGKQEKEKMKKQPNPALQNFVEQLDVAIPKFVRVLDAAVSASIYFFRNITKGNLSIKLIETIAYNNKPKEATDSCTSYSNVSYCFSPPETKRVRIDGENRTVYRLYHIEYNGEVTPVTLAPSLLNEPGSEPIVVYIQKHALYRLEQRIDAPLQDDIIFLLSNSILLATELVIIKSGSFLIPYYYENLKLGYLACQRIENVGVVVKTFLFITNSGTPEGFALDKVTGLKKDDKKFLLVDKLSTFANMDISELPSFKKILDKSNLSHLAELHENITSPKKETEEGSLNRMWIKNFLAKSKKYRYQDEDETTDTIYTPSVIEELEAEKRETSSPILVS